jgi:protein phosphatase
VSDVIVDLCARTDVGRTREHNEDAFLVADLAEAQALSPVDGISRAVGPRGLLFMVADGMGGAAAGELASAMAIDAVFAHVRSAWGESTSSDSAAFAEILSAATSLANERIYQYAVEHPATRGMGTTATVAGLWRDTLVVAQVGDSRAYLVRNGQARQLTKDQSLLQRLVDAGEITAAEAERSERRNIILQALGPEPLVTVDVTTHTLQRGDAVVLCTDGLTGVVRAVEIAQMVEGAATVASACVQLIAGANARGGPDNVTVVVVRIEGGVPPGTPARPLVLGPLVVPRRRGERWGMVARWWRGVRALFRR